MGDGWPWRNGRSVPSIWQSRVNPPRNLSVDKIGKIPAGHLFPKYGPDFFGISAIGLWHIIGNKYMILMAVRVVLCFSWVNLRKIALISAE